MTAINHTPAPWNYRLASDNPDAWEIVASFCESPIAEVPRWQDEDGNDSEEAEANLKAMVAVPALIAACRMVVERWEGGDLAEAARLCQEALQWAASASPAPESAEFAIYANLASRRQIAVLWGIEDVQSIRPDLDDDQAWHVLQAAERHHDCNYGITWETLELTADSLFEQPNAD